MGMAKREHVVAILSQPDMAARWSAARGSAWSEVDVDAMMGALEPAMQAAASRCAQLIPGAAETAAALDARGIKVGSTTGYTRTMMAPILKAAAEQGYAPAVTVCAGETPFGRPAPLMLWQAMAELGAWPVHRCVAVDDAPVGIVAARNAGLWAVGLAGSGNGVGLDAAAYAALSAGEKAGRMHPVIADFVAAGADFIVETVASLPLALEAVEAALAAGKRPGGEPARFLPSDEI